MEQLSALHQQGCETQQVCGHYQQHMSNLAMHHCIIASILPMNSATQDFFDILSISFKGWSVLLTEQMPLHCPSHRSRVASNENRKCQKKTDRKMITWTKTDRQPLFDLKTIVKPVSNFSPWQRWDWSPAASLTSKYQPGIFQKSIGFPPVFHQIRLEIRRLSPFHGFSQGFSILQTTNQPTNRQVPHHRSHEEGITLYDGNGLCAFPQLLDTYFGSDSSVSVGSRCLYLN